MAIDSDTVWGTAARVATARGADECSAGECGADERGAGKSDAGCDGVGCNVAGRKSTAPDVRCDTSRHEAAQVEHEMLPQPDVCEPHTVGHDGRERWLGERGAGKRGAGDLQRHGQTCGGWRSGMGRSWMGAGNGGREAWLLNAVGWYLEDASFGLMLH